MRSSMDGNAAAAHVAYAMSDTAFIYPITPYVHIGNSPRFSPYLMEPAVNAIRQELTHGRIG